MANEETGATGGTEQQTQKPTFGIDRIYLKDVSLECPKGFEAFSNKSLKPRVEMDINNVQNKITDELYEVVLGLTVNVKDVESDESIYLIEIEQAGTFRVVGLPEQDLRRVLSTMAPSTLFPYAREAIDDLVLKANFPPLRLSPVNFDMLFSQALQKQQEKAEANPSGDTVQ
ncbi:MAG: protein-export chaperone SecB [Pseudomonadales bacterium]